MTKKNKGVQKDKTQVTQSPKRTIKVIPKETYDEGTSKTSRFYGIAIYEGEELFYRPIYPFTQKNEDKTILETFVKEYEKELLAFYKNGHNYSFGLFVYGFGSGLKDKFRDDWFEKGIVFY